MFFNDAGDLAEEEKTGEGEQPAPLTPIHRAGEDEARQMEADAAAASAAQLQAEAQDMEDVEEKELLKCMAEEALAEAALAANARQQQEEWTIESSGLGYRNRMKFENLMTQDTANTWGLGDFDSEAEEYKKKRWVEMYTAVPETDTSRRAWLLWPSVIKGFAKDADYMIDNLEQKYAEGVAAVNKHKAENERTNRAALRGPRSPQVEIEKEASQRQKNTSRIRNKK